MLHCAAGLDTTKQECLILCVWRWDGVDGPQACLENFAHAEAERVVRVTEEVCSRFPAHPV